MNTPPRQGSSRRKRPWLIGLLLVLVGLPLAGYAALLLVLNSDAVRPRVEAAVRVATGRDFTLSGPVGLKASLVPVVTLDGPVLANAPGGSRPEMLRARRIEAEVALLPLLSRRVELRSLAILGADLLLEVDAAGRGNWQFTRAARPEGAPATPAAPSRPFGLDVGSVTLEASRVIWRASGLEEVVEVPRLVLRGSERGLLAEGQVVARGVAATVNGSAGPLAALLGEFAGEWPFRLGLSAPGLNAEADGALALPFRGGWRARLAATADTAARLAPALPGVALPEARGLSLVAETGAETGLRALHVSLAEATLRQGAPGLLAGPLRIDAAAPDAPVTLGGTLRSGALAVNLGAQGPSLRTLVAGGGGPVAITLEGEGLAGSVNGAVAPGRSVAGTDWVVSLRAPDLRALGARAGFAAAPGLHEAALDGRARVLADGVDVLELVLASREAAGRASFGWRVGAVPHGQLRAVMERVDADALRAPAPAAPAPAEAAPVPMPAPAAGARPDGRVIPERPVDVSAIRNAGFSLDAEATVALLRSGGADWRDLSLRAVLEGGKLTAERFSAVTPGGPLTGRFSVEADGAAPRLSLALRSGEGGVEVGALLRALGVSPPISGPAALDLSLAGAGAGTRALAASLSGHLGLAMTGGQLDPRLLAGAASALRGAIPGEALGSASEIRCLALRFDLADGVAQSRALLLDTRVASTTGAGAANLGRDPRLPAAAGGAGRGPVGDDAARHHRPLRGAALLRRPQRRGRRGRGGSGRAGAAVGRRGSGGARRPGRGASRRAGRGAGRRGLRGAAGRGAGGGSGGRQCSRGAGSPGTGAARAGPAAGSPRPVGRRSRQRRAATLLASAGERDGPGRNRTRNQAVMSGQL